MKAKFVFEGIDNVLKAKDPSEIVDHFAQEIILEMLGDNAVSFYKQWGTKTHKFHVYQSNYNINQAFDNMNKEFGPGLFVTKSVGTESTKIPLEHVYPHKVVGASIIQYQVMPSQVETAIKELVAEAYISKKLGNGFHLKYFRYE